MNVDASSETVLALETSRRELGALVRDSEIEIVEVATGFEELARHADSILQLAGAVAGCVEDADVLSVLPRVQSLGAAARTFIHERMEATAGILETASTEAKLLDRLSELTRGQRSIARETQTLSVLTNIEVARLGQLGAGFQYLAHELDEFSQSVTKGTKELATRTDERKTAIEDTRRSLAASLPRMRQEFARIESDLGSALEEIEQSQSQLSRAPAQFRLCVEEIAGQISEVVAAVQSHDITRQQLEHVQEALALMEDKIRAIEENGATDAHEPPRISAGLAIQIYQMMSTRETVGHWVTQIGGCLEGILRISTSEIAEIGPVVVEQERGLSAQLARIEQLEQDCQAGNAEVQQALSGLSNLMGLVGEHVERSRSVRDRMQLLTFNSIVEASHLGSKADTILEISQSIKRISTSWSELTDRSAQAMDEILLLVEKSGAEMKAFSDEGNEALRTAQAETREGLEHLRKAAQFAAQQADEIEISTHKLQGRIAAVGVTSERLSGCFDRMGAVLGEIERIGQQWEKEYPGAAQRCDHNEMEVLFGASYTTEIERDVLRAALTGRPVPVAEQNLAGNDVELF